MDLSQVSSAELITELQRRKRKNSEYEEFLEIVNEEYRLMLTHIDDLDEIREDLFESEGASFAEMVAQYGPISCDTEKLFKAEKKLEKDIRDKLDEIIHALSEYTEIMYSEVIQKMENNAP